MPFTVSGSAASSTNADGTMNSGSVADSRARSAAVSASGSVRTASEAGTVYATSRFTPFAPVCTTTAAAATPGAAASADSISPSSIRKPRIFTWWSARPR